MFFKVKNARTLLWLHLGILQHLEDGKEKKTEETKNTTASSSSCYLPAPPLQQPADGAAVPQPCTHSHCALQSH